MTLDIAIATLRNAFTCAFADLVDAIDDINPNLEDVENGLVSALAHLEAADRSGLWSDGVDEAFDGLDVLGVDTTERRAGTAAARAVYVAAHSAFLRHSPTTPTTPPAEHHPPPTTLHGDIMTFAAATEMLRAAFSNAFADLADAILNIDLDIYDVESVRGAARARLNAAEWASSSAAGLEEVFDGFDCLGIDTTGRRDATAVARAVYLAGLAAN